ncbi:MAG: tRNA pseudouridine(55) synthase TruB, partial [Clostridia bacterium]|nr:tRNA pseudouridine(55) synthase TruB [Clostridia bacterium]
FLLIDKPEGITSFKAVSAVKRRASEKRVGHTGTLDPLASGVLPIFLGRATALAGILLEAEKQYTATVKLGITTDTADITGSVIDEKTVAVTKEELLCALEKFKGEILQTPPMYSALKKDGVRLYELARRGEEVEIEPRRVIINELVLKNFQDDTFEIYVSCSKGTYIRSLCRDIGEALGCGATMTALRRNSTCGFFEADCVSLSELTEENISDYLKSEEFAVMHLRAVSVSEKQAVRFSNGGQLSYERLKTADFADGELLRVKHGDKFLGIGVAENDKQQIAIKCVINQM